MSVVVGSVDVDVEFANVWEAEAALAADGDFQVGVETAAEIGEAGVAELLADGGLLGGVLRTLIGDLRKRDADLLAGRDVVVPVDTVVKIVTRNSDGRFQSRVAARVLEGKDSFLVIPLGIPIDEPVLFLLRHTAPGDRVRLLAELVRVFGDVVRFARLPESIHGNAVRGLGFLVGLLRTAVALHTENHTRHTSQESDADTSPGRDVTKPDHHPGSLPTHPAPTR